MTTVYFVRHAEAEGNTYRRMHGQYNSLITENGVRQIEALRARFEDIPVDACYASDLYRTCRTAQQAPDEERDRRRTTAPVAGPSFPPARVARRAGRRGTSRIRRP